MSRSVNNGILRREWTGALLAAVLVLSSPAARACCGASGCEIEPSGAMPRLARSARLGYEFELVPQNRRWADRSAAPAGAVGGHHDESYSVTRTQRFTAELGLSERWSVSAQVPFVSRSHGHVHNHHGARLADSWSVSGLGDLLLEARYAFLKTLGGSTVSAGLGGELPTGKRTAFNDENQAAEPGILPGSGSWDAVASVLWQKPVGRGGLFASLARRFNGPGDMGYRLGDVSMLHMGGTVPLGDHWLGLVQANWVVRARDWKGRTREDTTNSGGEAIYLSPGLERAVGPLSLSASVQLPVYQRVNGYQIVSDYAVRTGVGWRFTL